MGSFPVWQFYFHMYGVSSRTTEENLLLTDSASSCTCTFTSHFKMTSVWNLGNQYRFKNDAKANSCKFLWNKVSPNLSAEHDLCLFNRNKHLSPNNQLAVSSCCQTVWPLEHKANVAPVDIPLTLPSHKIRPIGHFLVTLHQWYSGD